VNAVIYEENGVVFRSIPGGHEGFELRARG